MKILYVITKSNFGGAQRYVYDLACAMREHGHEVAVALGGNGELQEKLTAKHIRVISVKSFQRDISATKEFHAAFELSRIIRQYRPDTVHLNSSKAGGIGALVCRLHRVPMIVFTAHGWPFHEQRGVLWRAFAWLGSYATALLVRRIILVSAFDLKHSYMLFVRKKRHLIKTAIPSIAFLPRADARKKLFSDDDIAAHEHDLWLVSTAELNHNKNLRIAIDTVATFNDTHEQKIFYTILGDGELKRALSEHILNIGADSHVSLRGYVQNSRQYLNAFDAFILPSLKEGMPYALIEAGAAGLASVASDVGGIPEIIGHEATGLLINPRSRESIMHALDHIASDVNIRETYGKSLQQKIGRQFSLEHMLEETAKIYAMSSSDS